MPDKDPCFRQPTAAELEILRALWRLGPSTVRDVHERINRDRPTGYTTVLKLMQIMAEKGLVVRDEAQRSHIYSPRWSERDTQSGLLRDLIDRAFGGSAEKLVLRAVETDRLSAEELQRIRDLIDAQEGQGDGSDS